MSEAFIAVGWIRPSASLHASLLPLGLGSVIIQLSAPVRCTGQPPSHPPHELLAAYALGAYREQPQPLSATPGGFCARERGNPVRNVGSEQHYN